MLKLKCKNLSSDWPFFWTGTGTGLGIFSALHPTVAPPARQPPGPVHDHYYFGGDRNWSASSESNGGVLFLPPASTRLHNTTKGQASSMGSMTVPTWTTATFQQLYFRLSLQLTNSDHELTLTMATPRPQSSSASYRHLISYFARGLKERPTTWK